MGGPSCEVVLDQAITNSKLEVIDEYLGRISQSIVRHRKGRTWKCSIDGRPIDVFTGDNLLMSPDEIGLSAGCNSPQDYEVLRRVSQELATLLDGLASEPIK
jgi:hypothetical protein